MEPGRLQSMGWLESDKTERLHFHFSLSCFGEGNGNPLQCSCLESPKDGEAWWAAIYGVAQSQTRLKRLSSSRIYTHGSLFMAFTSLPKFEPAKLSPYVFLALCSLRPAQPKNSCHQLHHDPVQFTDLFFCLL